MTTVNSWTVRTTARRLPFALWLTLCKLNEYIMLYRFLYTVTYCGVTVDGILDWILDLLTTLTHNS
jgi:hypothetical protein